MVRGRLSGDDGGGVLPGGLLGGGMGESGTVGSVGSTVGRVVIMPDGRVTIRVGFSVEVIEGCDTGLTRTNVSAVDEVEGCCKGVVCGWAFCGGGGSLSLRL